MAMAVPTGPGSRASSRIAAAAGRGRASRAGARIPGGSYQRRSKPVSVAELPDLGPAGLGDVRAAVRARPRWHPASVNPCARRCRAITARSPSSSTDFIVVPSALASSWASRTSSSGSSTVVFIWVTISASTHTAVYCSSSAAGLVRRLRLGGARSRLMVLRPAQGWPGCQDAGNSRGASGPS